MAEVLRAAGYRTAVFGKWHLGARDDMSSLAQGFDEFFGHKEGCIDNYSHFFYWQGPNRHDLWDGDRQVHEDGKYFPDLVTGHALRFIEENKDRPFLLYLPFNMPHYPLQAQAEFRQEYEGVDEPRKAYAALISELDGKSISQVIASSDVPSPHEVLHWQVGSQWAIRKGKWKLVWNGPTTKLAKQSILATEFLLSDLELDYTETINLADKHPDVLNELVGLHNQWASQGQDTISLLREACRLFDRL